MTAFNIDAKFGDWLREDWQRLDWSNEFRSNPKGYNQYKHMIKTPQYGLKREGNLTEALVTDGNGKKVKVSIELTDNGAPLSDKNTNELIHGVELGLKAYPIPVRGVSDHMTEVTVRVGAMSEYPGNIAMSRPVGHPNVINVDRVETFHQSDPNVADRFSPSAHQVPLATYVTAHEFGHISQAYKVGAVVENANGIHTMDFDAYIYDRAPADASSLSYYARKNSHEAYAEAFADFAITGGTSSNKFTQKQASRFGWKASSNTRARSQRANPVGYNQYKHMPGGAHDPSKLTTPKYKFKQSDGMVLRTSSFFEETSELTPEAEARLRKTKVYETTLSTGLKVTLVDPTGQLKENQIAELTHGVELSSKVKIVNGATEHMVYVDPSLPYSTTGSTGDHIPNVTLVNPNVFDTTLPVRRGWFTSAGKTVPLSTYVVAHEYGHNQYFAENLDKIHIPQPAPPWAAKISGYAATEAHECQAEMFAEFAISGGKTTNVLVQTYADQEGWKVP